MFIAQAPATILAAMAGIGIAYQGFVLSGVRRFMGRARAVASESPAVTLLKPLHGAEPRMAENLASFLAQDYAGPVQMVCGVNEPGDTALPVARSLPGVAISPGPRAPGANGKVGNLVAMMPLAVHDVLVLSDSDMVVGPDYLATITAALAQPGVGAVSCCYVGRGDTGFWSRLGAVMISFQAAPNMMLAVAYGLEKPCMGSTIALHRTTLEAIGGFGAFADVLADDYAIGAAIAARGQSVAVPPLLLTHAGTEKSAAELWRHFLRWAVTIRDLNPAGHFGSAVTQPLPLALLAATRLPQAGLALAALAVLARMAVAVAMRRASGQRIAPLWMLPIADIFAFGVFCTSLIARKIDWRGSSLTMLPGGRITPVTRETV